jgi:uncharacterized protein GlcG (DUF336 family)
VRAGRRHRLLHAGDVAGQGGGGGGVPPLDDRAGQGQALPTPGGAPLLRGGRVIGGIGCGGGTGEEDQQCADAGAAAIT